MTSKISLLRLASLLVAFGLVAASVPADARIHSLSGNVRFQIGNGLPIPIGFTPAPNGKVAATGAATIRLHAQGTTGGTGMAKIPSKIVLDPGQLTHPGGPIVLPVFNANPNVFQVQTNIPVQFPKNKIMFNAGGRTGAATVAFCPGSTVTAMGNPGCASAGAGSINGRLIYTATAAQFGGPASASAGGSANVAVRPPGASGAPCAFGGGAMPLCLVAFALATPNTMIAAGNPFGFINTTSGAAPSPGLFNATIGAGGTILAVTPPSGLGPGAANPATSFAGPWTTGQLTISVTANAGPTPEIFVITGSDGRASDGTGSISLVSGSVSARLLTGPNSNRGWLNLVVGPEIGNVPVMPLYGVAALVGLTALSGAYALRRKNR